jgi:hypothetical protein
VLDRGDFFPLRFYAVIEWVQGREVEERIFSSPFQRPSRSGSMTFPLIPSVATRAPRNRMQYPSVERQPEWMDSR